MMQEYRPPREACGTISTEYGSEQDRMDVDDGPNEEILRMLSTTQHQDEIKRVHVSIYENTAPKCAIR